MNNTHIVFPMNYWKIDFDPDFVLSYVTFDEKSKSEFPLQSYCGVKGEFHAYLVVPSALGIDYLSDKGLVNLTGHRAVESYTAPPDGQEIMDFMCIGWDYKENGQSNYSLEMVNNDINNILSRIMKYYNLKI